MISLHYNDGSYKDAWDNDHQDTLYGIGRNAEDKAIDKSFLFLYHLHSVIILVIKNKNIYSCIQYPPSLHHG